MQSKTLSNSGKLQVSIASSYRDYWIALTAAILWVVLIDLPTNFFGVRPDNWFYPNMAENGILGNQSVLALYAYRYGTPMLARAIIQISGVPLSTAFRLIAYIGTIGQLFATFVLARRFGATLKSGLIIMAVIALSLYNVKYLLFDIYRPDLLAYMLMIIATLAILDKRYTLALITVCAGLMFREFMIALAAVLGYELVARFVKQHSLTNFLWVMLAGLAISLVVIMPRLFIPVIGSDQWIDPVNAPETTERLVTTLLETRRNFNIVFMLGSYLLPIVLLVTPGRIKYVWRATQNHRAFLFIYIAVVLLLMLYGGYDLYRFATYLFIPQIIILTFLLKESIHPLEIIYMLVAIVLFNRILEQIPFEKLSDFLDFYGGFGERLTRNNTQRVRLLVVMVLIGFTLKASLSILKGDLRNRFYGTQDSPA